MTNLSTCLPYGWSSANSNADGVSILFYTTWTDMAIRMDRSQYDLIEGLVDLLHRGDHSTFNALDVWGPGMKGWDAQQDTATNIGRRITCCPSLIVWNAPRPEPHVPTASTPGGRNGGTREPLIPERCRGKTEVMVLVGDCNVDPADCRLQLSLTGATIWAHNHWHLMLSAAWLPPPAVLLYNSPFCAVGQSSAHPRIAEAMQEVLLNPQKRSGIVAFGIRRPFYRLRTRIHGLIANGKLPHARYNPHPSPNKRERRAGPKTRHHILTSHNVTYDVLKRETCGYNPLSPTFVQHVDTSLELVSTMGQARICIFDAGVQRKMLRKYMHAFALGCVPAADIPDDMPPAARRAVIRLDPDWTDERLAQTLELAYNDVARLGRLRAVGRRLFESTYSCTAVAEDMLDMIEAKREGRAGRFWSNTGHTLGCEARFQNNASLPLFPWCHEVA